MRRDRVANKQFERAKRQLRKAGPDGDKRGYGEKKRALKRAIRRARQDNEEVVVG